MKHSYGMNTIDIASPACVIRRMITLKISTQVIIVSLPKFSYAKFERHCPFKWDV